MTTSAATPTKVETVIRAMRATRERAARLEMAGLPGVDPIRFLIERLLVSIISLKYSLDVGASGGCVTIAAVRNGVVSAHEGPRRRNLATQDENVTVERIVCRFVLLNT